MRQYEEQKELNRKRALISFITLFLGLSTPTVFSISKQANLSLAIQVVLYVGLLIALFTCLFQKRQLKVKLEKISNNPNAAYQPDLSTSSHFKKSS